MLCTHAAGPRGTQRSRKQRGNTFHLWASEHRLNTFCRVSPRGTLLHRHNSTNNTQGWAKITPFFPEQLIWVCARAAHMRPWSEPMPQWPWALPRLGLAVPCTPTAVRLIPHYPALQTAARQAAHGQPCRLLLDGDQGVGAVWLSHSRPQWARRGQAKNWKIGLLSELQE